MSKKEREMRVEKRYLKKHPVAGAAASAADDKVNGQKRRMDGTLLILVLLLVVCGLIFLYSTSAYNGRVKFHDPAYYFKKQLFATSLGMMGMYLVSCMDYHILTRMAPFLYVVSMGLSLAVLLFGDEYNGSKRWLSIGPLSFQPSEFAKVAVILLLTYVITNSEKRQDSLLHMAGTMALLLPIVGLVGTNNLSTAIIILGIGVILIFVSNPKYLPFVGIGGVGVLFIGIFLSMASYRLERIAIWRNPEKYEKGFQTIQGLYAIGSGGIFGKGLGSSLQKLGFVPEAQNDMIFSIICEETGLIGACLLILVFALLIWRLMVIATHARDLCGALIAAGIMGHMAIQVILNIAVVTNTIPNTGITLPFVSYGGTSVLFLMGEMGLALSVSRTRSP
jgi:cell division protein FtsW